MANRVVVYRSLYGSTRQYAEWLAALLHCEAFDLRTLRAKDLRNFDTIVYGGPLYRGEILGVKFLRKHLKVLGDKHLVVFSCGLRNPDDKTNQRNITDQLAETLTNELMEHIKVFHVRGAIDYRKLSLLHRSMMALVRRSLAARDPAERTADEQQLLDAYGQVQNHMDVESLGPIVDYVRELRRRS